MSTIAAGNTSTTGLVQSSDTTGSLVFQTNGTTTALTLGTNQSATFAGNMIFSDGSNLSNGYLLFKNRIINGSMVVDQRNNGSSVTPSNGTYTLDRWKAYLNGGGAYSVQKSSTAPTGFINSLLVTVTTSKSSILSGDYYILTHLIEGINVGDFAWGTASACSVTLSFWVRSSLTGTFSGSLENNAGNRAYPFVYTINSANTWEQKSITIPGDTTGTWLTNTSAGIVLRLSLGMGSTYSGTSNTWAAADYYASTSETTKLISTLGATFYLTGVQLERGSIATSFEYRPYPVELHLCERYCEVFDASLSSYSNYTTFGHGWVYAATNTLFCLIQFKTMKRVYPSVSYSALSDFDVYGAPAGGPTSISIAHASSRSMEIFVSYGSSIGNWQDCTRLTANNNKTAKLTFEAEL